MRKHFALAALLAGMTGLATAAHAVPALQIEVFDGATLIGTSPISSAGSLIFSTTDANFSHITVASTGVPLVANPDMGTINVNVSSTATFSGPTTLHILATQVGLGGIPAVTGTTSSTYNALIGSPGPLTASMWTDAANTPFAETTLEARHVFTPAGGVAQTFVASTTIGPYAGPFSETQVFDTTFTAPGQVLQSAIQFVAGIPEPSSVILLGTGLVALGVTSRRRPS